MNVAGQAFLLGGTQALGYVLSLARNLLLARLLSKDDFGLAAAFAMTIAMLELAGRMAFGKQVVQDDAGDAESFQGNAQAFQFLAGLASAVLVLAMSAPMAVFFKVPQVGWAFAVLALGPLLKGLEHLDKDRAQRDLRFGPQIGVELFPQVAVTALVWPLARAWPDVRAVLALLLLKAVLGCAMTHVVARRRYRWAWNPALMKSLLAFSAPLIANGLLMFVAKQGDQLLVGSCLTLGELAVYTICFALAGVPWFISAQVVNALLLPLLARAKHDPAQFEARYGAALAFTARAALGALLPLGIAGEQVVRLLYGPHYDGAGPVMAWLGAASALRFLRITPAVAAMARADTANQMVSNAARIIALPLAAVALALGGGLGAVAASAVVGELLAGAISLRRLQLRQGIAWRRHFAPVAYLVVAIAGAEALVLTGAARWSWPVLLGAIAGFLTASAAVAWWWMPAVSHVIARARVAPVTTEKCAVG